MTKGKKEEKGVIVEVEKGKLASFLEKVTIGGEISLVPLVVENGMLRTGDKGITTEDRVAAVDGWIKVEHSEPVEEKVVDVKQFKDGVDRVDGDTITLEFKQTKVTIRGRRRWKEVPYSSAVANIGNRNPREINPPNDENFLFETSTSDLKAVSKDIKEVYKRDASGGYLRIAYKGGEYVFTVGDLYNTGRWETVLSPTEKNENLKDDFVCNYPGAVMSKIFDVATGNVRFYSNVEALPNYPMALVEETDDWSIYWIVAPRIEE